jgi:hypothetical protein
MDGGSITAIDALGKGPKPEAVAALSDVVRRAKWSAVRRDALAELARLDEEVADAVSAETGVKLRESAARDDSVPLPGPTTRSAIDALVRHGVLEQADADRALAATRPADDPDAPDGSVLGALYDARRFHWFDAETGTVPNRHDLLIVDLARASAGRFKPEAVLETYEEPAANSKSEEGKYLLQFVHGNRLYRIRPHDLGDWYDVQAVLAIANRALEDAGLAERFVPLKTGGQDVSLIFAPPAALAAAAKELGLELSDDPDQARKEGKAFEEEALKSFREKEVAK